MKNIIISFKNRNTVMAFSKIFKSNGIIVHVIDTPRGISTSCGLSLKLNYLYYNKVLSIIQQLRPNDLNGIFMSISEGISERFERLV